MIQLNECMALMENKELSLVQNKVVLTLEGCMYYAKLKSFYYWMPTLFRLLAKWYPKTLIYLPAGCQWDPRAVKMGLLMPFIHPFAQSTFIDPTILDLYPKLDQIHIT